MFFLIILIYQLISTNHTTFARTIFFQIDEEWWKYGRKKKTDWNTRWFDGNGESSKARVNLNWDRQNRERRSKAIGQDEGKKTGSGNDSCRGKKDTTDVWGDEGEMRQRKMDLKVTGILGCRQAVPFECYTLAGGSSTHCLTTRRRRRGMPTPPFFTFQTPSLLPLDQ